jgi:hypothetical protein
MTTANRFEDRLLDQLQEIVAARPAPTVVAQRRPRRRRLALAGVSVATATAAVAPVVTGSDVTPSAYAVQPRADGSVTVAIRGLEDAAGLQRSLRAAGVPANVDYAPAGRAGCVTPPPHPSGPTETGTTRSSRRDVGPSLSGPGPGPGPGVRVSTRVSSGDDGVTFSIDPGNLKPGEKIYITTSTGKVNSIGMAVAKEKPAAPCR